MRPSNATAWYKSMLLAYTTTTGALLLRWAGATKTTTGIFTAGLRAVATVLHIPGLLKEPPPLWPHDKDDRRWTFSPVMNTLLGTTWLALVYHYRLWPVDATHFLPSSSTSGDKRIPFLLLVVAFWGLKVW